MRSRILILCGLVGPAMLGASELPTVDAALAGTPELGLAGVAVIDTHSHQVVYASDADLPLSLASTTKLLVASAALLQLGTTYRFHTRLMALGPVAEGMLPGLGVIGGGSPCLDEHFAPDKDPDSFFRSWAAQLRAQGITHVAGDIVIDNRLFSGPIRPATYPSDPENQQRWFSAPASAFAWNDNCIEVRLLPTAPARQAQVEIRPRSPRISIINQTHTTSTVSRPVLSRELDSNTIIAAGTCSSPTAWFPLAMQSDPDLLNGDQLRSTLIAAGIAVDGTVRLGAVDSSHEVLVDLQQELLPAVRLMNQHSQNLYGEQLLRLIAVARGKDGSIEAGRHAVLEVLGEHFGQDFAQVSLLDGCGLSYGNQATARTMAHLLDVMLKTPLGDAFMSTLKDRACVGRLAHVKTGTLAIATCLVGYLDSKAANRYAFAILLNKGDAADLAWAPKMRDRVLEAIAESLP